MDRAGSFGLQTDMLAPNSMNLQKGTEKRLSGEEVSKNLANYYPFFAFNN